MKARRPSYTLKKAVSVYKEHLALPIKEAFPDFIDLNASFDTLYSLEQHIGNSVEFLDKFLSDLARHCPPLTSIPDYEILGSFAIAHRRSVEFLRQAFTCFHYLIAPARAKMAWEHKHPLTIIVYWLEMSRRYESLALLQEENLRMTGLIDQIPEWSRPWLSDYQPPEEKIETA